MAIVRAICQPIVLPAVIGAGGMLPAPSGPTNPFPAFEAAQVNYNYDSDGYDGPLPDPTVAAATLAGVYVGNNALTQPQQDFSGCASLAEWDSPNNLTFSGAFDCSLLPATTAIVNLADCGLTSITNIGSLTGAEQFYANNCPLTSVSSMATCVAMLFPSFTGCGLSSAEIDGILADLDTAGVSGGTAYLTGNSVPGAAGLVSKESLEGRGWTVDVDA